MKTCKRYNHLIAAYVDGTAGEDEVARLAAHREGCPQCDALARELMGIRDLVRDLPRLQPSSPLMPALSAKLRDQKVRWFDRFLWTFRMSDMRLPAAVAVVLILAIGAGMVAVKGASPVSRPTFVAQTPTHLDVYQPPAMTAVINASAPRDDYYTSCERYHQAYVNPDDLQLTSY